MAVQSLKLLGGLTDDVRSGVIRFLMETPYSGLREPANLALMTMENTAYVLETADGPFGLAGAGCKEDS